MVYTFDEASKKQLKIELDTLISCASPYIVRCYNAFYTVNIPFKIPYSDFRAEGNRAYSDGIHGSGDPDLDSEGDRQDPGDYPRYHRLPGAEGPRVPAQDDEDHTSRHQTIQPARELRRHGQDRRLRSQRQTRKHPRV